MASRRDMSLFQRQPSQNRDAASLPFPVYGVTIQFFGQFIDDVCGGEGNIQEKTTKDICEEFIKPMTNVQQRSLCEVLVRNEHLEVGVAEIFISHAWSCKFLDVYDALKYHFRDQIETTYLWFDLFSNNQHATVDRDFEWWCGTFKGAIGAMQHVVMVLAPWHDPVPLTRAWCLFELYCSAETNCTFEVAMSRREHAVFVESMVKDVEGCLLSVLNTIRCERSQAFDANDQRRIFEAVERTVGFSQINSMVFNQLRKWFVQALEESLVGDSLPSPLSPISPTVRSLSLYESLMHHHHQNTTSANDLLSPTLQRTRTISIMSRSGSEPFDYSSVPSLPAAPVKSAREVSEEWEKQYGSEDYGDDEAYWARLSALAQIFVLQGDSNKAQVLLKPLYNRLLQRLGSDHPQTLSVGRDLAMAQQRHGHYSDAQRQYLLDYDQRRRLFGADHPETLVAMNFVATTANHLGRYAEAETLHRLCLATRLRVLTDAHADTFWSQNNLALALRDRAIFEAKLPNNKCLSQYSIAQRKRWVEEAISLLRSCHAGRSVLLGKEHTLTLGALHNLANNLRDLADLLLENHRNLADEDQALVQSLENEAESLYETCISKWTMLLGSSHCLPLLARQNASILKLIQINCDTSSTGTHVESLLLHVISEQRQIVSDMKQHLGEKHPFALQSVQSLASTLMRYHQQFGSIYQYKEQHIIKEEISSMLMFCISERREVLGIDHPATILVQSMLEDFEDSCLTSTSNSNVVDHEKTEVEEILIELCQAVEALSLSWTASLLPSRENFR